jgi:hypothetical protein
VLHDVTPTPHGLRSTTVNCSVARVSELFTPSVTSCMPWSVPQVADQLLPFQYFTAATWPEYPVGTPA